MNFTTSISIVEFEIGSIFDKYMFAQPSMIMCLKIYSKIVQMLNQILILKQLSI